MITENIFDVAVIGSGPSGSIAADKLSSSGLKVILFEKAKLPRYKTCGGGIVNRVVKYLPVHITAISERNFKLIEIHDHQADFHYSLKRNFPIVYMTMRNDFDFALLEKAKFSGTSVLDNCEVYDVIAEKEIVTLKTMRGEFKTRFVIGADGAQGISVKKSGLKIKKKDMPALECEISVTPDDMQRFSKIRFDFGFIPEGYAWVFPKKNHLSVGLGIFSLQKLRKNLNIYLNKYLQLLNFKKIDNIEKHGFYIPVGLKKNKLTKNRILLTGDAAALADSVTAEGITSAVLSGQLAAEAIIEGKLNEKLVSSLYNKKINKYFYSELNAELLLNRVFYNYSFLRIFIIKRYGVKFCELIADIISGEKKYGLLLKNPTNYFKLIKYYLNPVRETSLKPGHNLQNY